MVIDGGPQVGHQCHILQSRRNYSSLNRQHAARFDVALSKVADVKIDAAVAWAIEARENKSHVAVLCHLKATAREIAEGVSDAGEDVFIISGDEPTKKRAKTIEAAKASPTAVLVCTIDSMGLAIDLTFCTVALFAELHYVPGMMLQALKRFYRLNSKLAVCIYFLIARGTHDEIVMAAMADKLKNIVELVKQSSAEQKVHETMMSSGETDDVFYERMRGIAESYNDSDPYL